MVLISAMCGYPFGCAAVSAPHDIDETHLPARPKVVPEWQAGDDIPGWEGYEYDCPVYSGANVATVSFPSIWFSVAGMASDDTQTVISVGVDIADCTDKACGGSGDDPGNAPDVLAIVVDRSVTDLLLKTGYYGAASERKDSQLVSTGEVPVGGFTTDGMERIINVEFCLSRFRPDELRGLVYVTYSSRGTLSHNYFDDALVQYPFDVTFEDHAAWDDNTPGSDPSFADLVNHSIYYGGFADYDHAWDWDAITDPAIRTAVYDRYTPWNWP